MLIDNQFIRYLNLPQVPDQIVDNLRTHIGRYEIKQVYNYSQSFTEELNEWTQKNICDTIYFALQIISGDLCIHHDYGPSVKLNYVIDTGGPGVQTHFWSDDKSQLLETHVIDPCRWHLINVKQYHSVSNVMPGLLRFSITGSVYSRAADRLAPS